jgi:phage-related protein
MASPKFPNINIGEGSSRTKKPRVLTVQFGDGYSQRIPDGINPQEESWSLQFPGYTEAQIKTLVAFFDGLNGVGYFRWTAPFDSEEKKWVQDGEYTVSPATHGAGSMSVKIKRVYDLGN